MVTPGSRAAVLVLAAALTLAACASRDAVVAVSAAPSAAPAVPLAPGAALAARLSALFSSPDLAHAHLGVLARSLLTGETLFAINERRMFVPASSQKLLTVAAAARTLGWDFRYTTRIMATGPLRPDGTLDGHLVVVGSGDPTINPRHPERWHALDDWAAQVAARGVRVIGGHLIGDDNAFTEPGWGSGWSWDDLVADYGSPVGALQYHENEVEVLVGPGMEPGRRAIIATAPFGHGLLIDNEVITAAADQPARLSVERVPGTIFLTVRGQVPAESPARRRVVAVDNPTTLFVNAFREALARKGVVVAGSALDIDELRDPGDEPGTGPGRGPKPFRPSDLAAAATWVEDRSPPLYEIVDPLLKWSRNGYAETLLWTMSPKGVPASEAAGLSAMRAALESLGVDASLYAAFDGSGLSRYDMVTAEALVRVLAAVWNDPALVGPYRLALPVAGVSGSLANRLGGTSADGRVWAKTGSMFNIRSLAGYVLTSDSEPVAVAFLANNYIVPSAEVEALFDRALEQLAAFRR